jgi:excisionase family DNA binding protein
MTTTEKPPPIALKNKEAAERESEARIINAVKTAEAAKRLSVSPKTVRSLIKRGLLKSNRATRHQLIPLEEIERFLRS